MNGINSSDAKVHLHTDLAKQKINSIPESYIQFELILPICSSLFIKLLTFGLPTQANSNKRIVAVMSRAHLIINFFNVSVREHK
jgi:hypothetical protein